MPLLRSMPEKTDSYGSFRQVMPSLLFLVLLFFLNFSSRVIFSPLLPVIEAELKISHAASGSFFFYISSGYFFTMVLSGFVAKRINHKRTIAFSIMSSGLALLFASMGTTLLQLQLALFCLGMAAGPYLPSGLATISSLVSPSHRARGMAVHELAPNLGFAVSPLLCELMLRLLPWRQGILLFGIIICIAGLVYFIFTKGYSEQGHSPDPATILFFLKMADFWILTLLFSLAICSTLGIYAMLPLFLVSDHSMETAHANGLVAISRIAAVGMPIIGGWLGDRFGNRLVMGYVLLFGGIFTTFLGLCPGWLLIFPVIVQPMIAVCFFPSAFAILSNLGPPDKGSVAISLAIPLAFLAGAGVMPFLIGMVGDIFSIGVGFAGSGLLMLVGAVALFFVSTVYNSLRENKV